jgi:hypothetical protein
MALRNASTTAWLTKTTTRSTHLRASAPIAI